MECNKQDAAIASSDKQLMQAIERSDLKLIHRLVLEENVKLSNFEAHQLFRLLELSVTCYDATLVRKLLNCNIPLRSIAGGKLLWHAIGGNDLEIALMLVRAGVDLEVRNYNDAQSTPLHVLAKSHDSKELQFAEFIMDRGADINAVDCKGRSVLYHAINNEKANSLLMKLLERNVQVNDKVFEPAATRRDASLLLPLLLTIGVVDLETKNRRAKIAIRELCRRTSNVSALQVVMDMVGSLSFEEIDEEQTLLLYAIDHGSLDMVNFLITRGADVNQVFKDGTFPLYKAASNFRRSEIIELLIQKGAMINNYERHSGRFPIHAASEIRARQNIQLLLCYGADINVIDFEDRTPYSLIFKFWSDIGHYTFIKHIAVLYMKKSPVEDDDLEHIKTDECHDRMFNKCLKELELLQSKLILDTSLFSILSMKLERLSILTKNDSFVDNFHAMILDRVYPIYAKDMKFVFAKAEQRKNRLLLKEEALYEALCPFLPYLAIKNIALHLWWCEK